MRRTPAAPSCWWNIGAHRADVPAGRRCAGQQRDGARRRPSARDDHHRGVGAGRAGLRNALHNLEAELKLKGGSRNKAARKRVTKYVTVIGKALCEEVQRKK